MSQPPAALSAPRPTLVVGGTIAIDQVKTPDAEASGLLGGSAAYAALALAELADGVLPFGLFRGHATFHLV